MKKFAVSGSSRSESLRRPRQGWEKCNKKLSSSKSDSKIREGRPPRIKSARMPSKRK
jgi:hypothetical protein